MYKYEEFNILYTTLIPTNDQVGQISVSDIYCITLTEKKGQ